MQDFLERMVNKGLLVLIMFHVATTVNTRQLLVMQENQVNLE